MPRFKYTAIKQNGEEQNGRIQANDINSAKEKLVSKGLMLTEIIETASNGIKIKVGKETTPKKKKFQKSFGSPINQEGLTIFTRQLSTLLQAGLPLVRAIDVMAKQEKRANFKEVLINLADNVRSGNPFSEGLLQNPKVFNNLYVNMVRAGESGGVLDVVLERLAVFMEKSLRAKKKVKAAMVYPIVVMSVAIFIVMLLMYFVVPRFQAVFRDMLKGAPLPRLTQFVIDFSSFIANNIILIIAIAIASIIGFTIFKRSAIGGAFLDLVYLKIPKFGDLLTKSIIARFTRTFGTLMSSGVAILQALNISKDILQNQVYSKALVKVHNNVRDGEPLAKSIDREKVFPSMVTSMLEVGEETGDIPEMMNRIADSYDEDVDNAIDSITSIIEPVMIVLLAFIVGTIVIALFLPIIEVIKTISS